MTESPGKRKFSVYLPVELYEDLRTDAFESRTNISEIVSELVAAMPRKFRQHLREQALAKKVSVKRALVDLIEAAARFTSR